MTLALSATTAWAQNADTAETLFQDAKALMAAGRYASACPKLVESNRIDPGTGTLLALALCHEGEGKTASAWAEFTDVAVASRREHRPDREKLALERVAALEPVLARLTITVPDDVRSLTGLEVRRDGVAIPRSQWGTAVPADPGSHLIEASAPGKKTFSTTAVLRGKRDTTAVVIALEPDPGKPAELPRPSETTTPAMTEANATPPLSSPVEPPESDSSSSKRTVGFVVGGVGVAALGAGAVFGVLALSKNSDAKSHCPNTPCTDSTGVDLNRTARTFANVSNVGIGLGVVGIGVGAYLILTSKSGTPSSNAALRVSPLVARGMGGLAFDGRW